MATPPPRSSWKDKRDRLVRSDFIGRQAQLAAFRVSVTDPEAQAVIIAISGQGGVGKTTLLKEFRRITEEYRHIAAYVDEGSPTNRVEDVPEALYRLAKDFEAQNPSYKFEKFQERYKTYRQKRQELEADPEAPSGMASGIGRAGIKLAMGSVKAVPGVSEMMGEFVDSDAVAEKGGEWLSFAWKKFRNQDEVQLVTEPLEVLTPLFLEEMNRIADKQRVVLLLDTYEVTGKFLDDWLRAVLDLRYGEDLTANFRLCIAGRDPLDRNAWAQLEPCIARSDVEPFTEAEARWFLASKGIQSAAVIGQIWKLSAGGLPLLVAMMAENAPTSVDAVVDPCELAVERFLKWETDGAKRQLAQDGALPRVLNEDVVEVLGDGQFEWLKSRAFVVRDEQQWRYHSVVREQMLRYQWQKSSKRWIATHGKLAAYYDEVRQGLGLEAGKEAKDERWRELSLEWLYHELCAAPQAKVGMALNGFLRALKQSSGFAQEWAVAMAQAGQEASCEMVRQWGERLRDGMVAQKEKRYEESISALTALLGEFVIEEKLKAVALNWRGSWYRRSEQTELALKDFQQAVEIDREDPKYWFDLALTYKNLNRYEEAIAAYQRAIELDPKVASPHNGLGSLYQEQKQYEEAIAAYRRAIELDPRFASPHNGLGSLYQEQKQYEESIASYQCAIEIDPKFAYPHIFLGILYTEQKQYEKAIASYQCAIEIDPKFAYPHIFLGILYIEQKQYEKAIASYQCAIEIDPKSASPHNDLGNLYKKQEQYEKAIASYQCAIEFDPKSTSPHNGLGNLYKKQEQYEEAIASYQCAIEIDPKSASPHIFLGNLYTEQEQYEKAIASYQCAIEIDPKSASPHNGLGNLYKKQEQYDEAIAAYQRAIEIDPKSAYPHNGLGSLYTEQNQYDEAIASYQCAIEIDPKSASPHNDLGNLYTEQKQYEKAIASYQCAIEIDPSNVAQRNLGYLQYQLGDYDASLCSFQKALDLHPSDTTLSNNLGYLYLLQGDVATAKNFIGYAIQGEPFDRAWLNLGLIQAQQGQIDEAKQSWHQGLNLMEYDSDWSKAVHCVFTVALGNPAEGLEQMQNLVNSSLDKDALKNALNDATILSRTPQPLEGIEQMIQLLQEALLQL